MVVVDSAAVVLGPKTLNDLRSAPRRWNVTHWRSNSVEHCSMRLSESAFFVGGAKRAPLAIHPVDELHLGVTPPRAWSLVAGFVTLSCGTDRVTTAPKHHAQLSPR